MSFEAVAEGDFDGGAVEGSSAESGAFEVDMKGSLTIGDEVELLVAGQFGGVEHDVRLWTEGDRLRAGPRGALTLDVPRPAELEAALVIGLTRMGVLHNVARLVAGAGPDHAEGGVTDWVQTTGHARAEAQSGEAQSGEGLRFGLVVAGEPSGRATLWSDAHGLPVRREQTVDFPEGQMRVLERYDWLEPPPEDEPEEG